MSQGLGNANIRLVQDDVKPSLDPIDVSLDDEVDPDTDKPNYDDSGNVISIDHPDGSITISLNGKPIKEPEKDKENGWYDNLAEKLDESDLNTIADDLIRAIDDDIESRRDWIESRSQGIRLLGLKVELGTMATAGEGAPLEGMSRVRHPLLQEAVLRFQANARSEMLPTDGPVKIRDDANGTVPAEDELALAFEKDMNHYLTVTATEYYPDTDRMFLLLGFGGSTFKKVYFCPLRNRPVSETVDADDLIVNNAATDLANASRVTHRSYMKPSTVRRLQILGVYRDVELGDPAQKPLDSVQLEKKNQQGVDDYTIRPDDRNREIYEVHCELDIKGYEHKYKGKKSGLAVPYRVTIDSSSRKVLSIIRNYRKPTNGLPEARTTFIKYTFVPGFGFYDIGLLNILGNTTSAVTAAWRELLDAGMFANFPGFLLAKNGARQQTNIFRIPPGGSQLVETGGLPISQAIMPLPYKEPSNSLMALTSDIAQTGQRVGGTSEMQVGEGRADAPVGTTLALIEQAKMVMNSVHKRMHASQAQEMQLIVDCFRENPESFWQRNNQPTIPWDQEVFQKALDSVNLVPQADPNTASHGQRVMKVMALKQLQATSPELYDGEAIDRVAIKALGWANPDQFFKPKAQRDQPSPEMMKVMAEMKIKQQDANTKSQDAQARSHLAAAQAQKLLTPEPQEGGLGMADMAELKLKLMAEQNKLEIAKIGYEKEKLSDDSRDQDRQADLAIQQSRMEIQRMQMEKNHSHAEVMQDAKNQIDLIKVAAGIEHDKNLLSAEQLHEHAMEDKRQAHDLELSKQQQSSAPGEQKDEQ